jgi:predicted anti-sigma-YlaC factor YlaD
MRCEELLEGLNDYVDGETQSALCQALQEHLADCNPCRIVVDNIRQTIMLYRAGRQVEFPAGLHQRLCDVLRWRWLIQSLSKRKPR